MNERNKMSLSLVPSKVRKGRRGNHVAKLAMFPCGENPGTESGALRRLSSDKMGRIPSLSSVEPFLDLRPRGSETCVRPVPNSFCDAPLLVIVMVAAAAVAAVVLKSIGEIVCLFAAAFEYTQ